MLSVPTQIFGMEIVPSIAVPEFVPALKMKPCGCSDKVLNDFNAWLLERFGTRRHMMITDTQIFMHPNTYHWFRSEVQP